jgi:hypothetical protein
MATTLGDLFLTGELKRLRESIPAGSREVLSPAQGYGLSDVKTTKDAVDHLVVSAIRLIKRLNPEDLNADHPAIGALATVLQHPQADASFLRLLPPEARPKVEEAVRARDGEWSPEKLEWNWAVFVSAFPQTPIHPRVPLAHHSFEPEALKVAWNTLMDLEALRAWGLIS